MSKVKFSEKFIRELPVKDKPYNLMEDNLRIRIYPTGTKSWSFYKTDLTGKRVPETLGTYPQVSFKKAKQMATVQGASVYTKGHGIETKARGITYRDFIESNHYQSTGKLRDSHITIMNNLVSDVTGLPKSVQDRPIKAITPTDIENYIDKRLTKDKAKKGTINKNLTNIRSVFRTAFEKGFVDENIMKRIKQLPDDTKTEKLSLTKDERQRLLKTANDMTLPQAYKRAYMSIFIALGLDTGCRKSELLGLKWSDFSNDNLMTVDNVLQNVEYRNWQSTAKLIAVNRRGDELPEKEIKEQYNATDRLLMLHRFHPSIDKTPDDLKDISRLNKALKEDGYRLKVDDKRSWYVTIPADKAKGRTERKIGVQESTMQKVKDYLFGMYRADIEAKEDYKVIMYDDNCNPVLEEDIKGKSKEDGNVKGYVDIGFMQDRLLFPQDKYSATAKKGSIKDIRGSFKTIRTHAGLPKNITPHTLRHHFCSDLAFQGISPFEIMRLADHKDIKTTMRYIHYVKQKDFSALDEADKKRGS